ncbi:MAG: methionyl-tRNA formyltransferase [Pirellulales bacterium]|nr:methionyl-tRNA formyltransferase [Pirellulales bacterium]
MLGTGGFAAPTFRALLDSRHQVLALVTQPVRERATGAMAPMREIARERGVPILDPPDVNDAGARQALAELSPDLFVVADYGQILSPETLAIPRQGSVNLHGSLLPKYRGAAPINWAIYHGETETGVTTIWMTPKVDAGPCLRQARTSIGPDETAADLEPRLAEIGAPAVLETIEAIEAGDVRPLAQDAALASRAPRLKKQHGAIDWSRPAQAIKNQVRAMEPWPRTFTHWLRAGHPAVRLIVERVEVDEMGNAGEAAPGTVLSAAGDTLLVAAGQGCISIWRLQPAGKRSLATEEFLRGYPVKAGDRFTAEP